MRKVRKYSPRDMKGLIYIAPWLIGLLVFQMYPFIESFIYSFADFNMHKSLQFVGLKNYIRLFTRDREFYSSLFITLRYTVFTVPGKIIFALLIAVILNRDIKGINVIRTVYYLPSLLSGSVAVSILWKLMFMGDGVINAMLGWLGVPPVAWLGSPKVALTTISMLEIWQFGSSMVLFLAALKQVPHELHEAAEIDGARKARVFFSVTLPMITPIIFFNLIMQTITALQNFTSAFVITGGGPMKSTYVLGMKLYTEAFKNYKMGYASAISWVLFAMILAVTLLLFRSSSMWVHYSDGEEM